MAKKTAKVEAEPEAPAPEPVQLTPVERFRAEFLLGEVRPLQWKALNGDSAKILSKHGVLCFADGSVVELPTSEAGTLASELRSIRPNDNIQLIS